MKILYIEDDPASMRVMQRIARHLGHELILASTAQDGLNAAQNDVQLILADVNLPDMNGLEMMTKMRAMLPQTPIVAVTAYARADDRDNCLAAGCTGYISKPFEYPDIATLIAQFTSG